MYCNVCVFLTFTEEVINDKYLIIALTTKYVSKDNKRRTEQKPHKKLNLQNDISIEVIQDYASHYLKTFWPQKEDTTTTQT